MKKILLGLLALVIVTGCSQTIPENAVYTFNGEVVTADEYYDQLMETYGIAYVYKVLENLVIGDVELTAEELAAAQSQYDSVIAYYADEESQAYLDAIVKGEGYTGIDDLLLYIQNGYRKQKVIGEYIDENFTNEEELMALQPRMVKHVLVEFDQDGTFTTATQLMIEEIDGIFATEDPEYMEVVLSDLIENGTVVFEDLGYVDANTSFETSFLEEALALEKGTLSGWVETSYGFHRIYVYGDTVEDFLGDTDFHTAVLGIDPSYENRALWNMLSNSVEFTDSFATQIKAHLEIED